MPVPDFLDQFVGDWVGTSRLHLSWLEPDQRIRESDSKLRLSVDRARNALTLSYDWENEGQTHDGVMILSGNTDGNLSAAWTDSWHMSGSLLVLKGQLVVGEPLVVHGKYQVEGHPEWGWNIRLDGTPEAFRFEMDNVDPEGNAEWAVQATYRKATQ